MRTVIINCSSLDENIQMTYPGSGRLTCAAAVVIHSSIRIVIDISPLEIRPMFEPSNTPIALCPRSNRITSRDRR